MFSTPASPCQRLHTNLFGELEVWLKRDDLLHTQISGNKFRKLKYPFAEYAQLPIAPHIVSMGGIWSNHLHALAFAAQQAGYLLTALVRGAPGMRSAMLDDIAAWGARIEWQTRIAYRDLRDAPEAWRVHAQGAHSMWLPEGGSAPAALRGVAELVAELPFIPDCIALACGTGATLAGVLAGLQGSSQVFAVAAINQGEYLHAEIARLLHAAGYPAQRNYRLLTDAQHGGYAKTTPALLAFCAEFSAQTGIVLEPIYTGKMLYALAERAHEFAAGSKIVAIHTGGMQGLRGML